MWFRIGTRSATAAPPYIVNDGVRGAAVQQHADHAHAAVRGGEVEHSAMFLQPTQPRHKQHAHTCTRQQLLQTPERSHRTQVAL